MLNRQFNINSLNFDGTVRRTWVCELIEQYGQFYVFSGIFDHDVDHDVLGLIKEGTVSYEYYWLDRWYNIFRFHNADGTLRNYYFNISMPPVFAGEELNFIDLDIDIIVLPDSSYQILDRDEFLQNKHKFNYPKQTCDKVESTLTELIAIIDQDDPSTIERFLATNRM